MDLGKQRRKEDKSDVREHRNSDVTSYPHVLQIRISEKKVEIRGASNELYRSGRTELSPFNYTYIQNGSVQEINRDWFTSYNNEHSVTQTLSYKSNGLSLRRYLPGLGDQDPLNAYHLGQQLKPTDSVDQFLEDLEKKERGAKNYPRRFSETGVQLFDRALFKPSFVYHNFTDQNMTENSNGDTNMGVFNPAYSPEVDTEPVEPAEPVEPVEQVTDVDAASDNETLTSPNVEIAIDDFDAVEKHSEKDNPSETDTSAELRSILKDSSKSDPSTTQPILKIDLDNSTVDESTDDVIIDIPNEDKTVKQDNGNTPVLLSVAPRRSNGETKIKTKSKFPERNNLSKSLKRIDQPPPPTDEKDEDMQWLVFIEKKFRQMAGENGEVDLDGFKKALGTRQEFFANRFFSIFDQDGSGTIGMGELMDGLRVLMKGTPAQKLEFLFDVYDVDGSGCIDRDELKNVLRACMEESSLKLTDENLQDLTDVLFDDADVDGSGEITFEELKDELEKHPGVIQNLTISAAQWLRGPDQSKSSKPRFRYFTKDYVINNLRKVVFFFGYWILNIILFCVAVYQYRDSNRWIHVARGCGLCLNFNCMWVLVLMLRKCITWLRMTQLCRILPFDQHILFHKMTGIAIAGFSLVHTIAHIGNAAVVSSESKKVIDPATNETSAGLETAEILFTTKAGIGWVDGSAFITGWILDVVLVIIVICSMPFVRRSGHFQVFYWSHMLYIPFWILVILHGPHFWKWFIVPGFLFVLEKASRSKLIKMARYGDTFIEEVNLLPSGVTHLVISRPLNFKYKPGDYLFIQIPAIAKQEWHPFTISSAPEMEGSIWLHVRSAGHWTNKLYKYFDELKVNEANKGSKKKRGTKVFEGFQRAYTNRAKSQASSKRGDKQKQAKNKVVKVKCYIDGPYGTGTREVFGVQHAVLIASGIGVTPMASILQSVWYKFVASRQTCPSCKHVWYNEDETEEMKLKKVDFIWINRDQRSFEWFLTLLSQLEVEQSLHHGSLENCIQIHLYMTAAQKKTDMKGIGLQIALDLMYDKNNRDLITGLRTKTNPGRPEWNKVFGSVKEEGHGRVRVFYCGNPALGKTVKEASARHGFSFSKENF